MAIIPSSQWPEHLQVKFKAARMNMLTNFPFFSQLAMYFQPAFDDKCPTAYVTAKGKFHINQEFMEKLSGEGMVFVLCHEVMHLVTMSFGRMPLGANHQAWNISSDCVINYLLNKSNVRFPDPAVIKPIFGGEWEKYDGWITEQVYYDMMKEIDEILKKMCNGSCGRKGDEPCKGGEGKCWWFDESGSKCDGHGGEGSEKDKSMWQERIASAYARGQAAGNMPGELDAFLTKLLSPKRDWRRDIRYAARTYLKGKHTWRKISRRTAGTVRTPGRDPKPPIGAVYCDSSGSMSDKQMQRAFSETAEIFRHFGGKGRMLLGDCEIYYDGEVDVAALTSLPIQRGGTDFTVLFERIAENGPDPAILICFTDLQGPFPDIAPNYPVVWCKVGTDCATAPWGREIEVDI